MKIKNKGKVYPSPSSSVPAGSSSSDGYVLSVLQLLPAAILALASVLSLEDREVLAYLITRSMKNTPNTSSSSIPAAQDPQKKTSKKGPKKSASTAAAHQPPMFDCDCFDCYRSYWFKWDSSPNRELIHQAIEAFEDHLANGERPKRNAGKGKRRDKQGRRDAPITADVSAQNEIFLEENAVPASPEFVQNSGAAVVPENEVLFLGSPEKAEGVEVNEGKVEDLGVDFNVNVAFRTINTKKHIRVCSHDFITMRERTTSSSRLFMQNRDNWNCRM
ncbi:hypothetical protein D8674_009372 [Pyrus ussuriensis x Pyrus communis]|uniref:Uncharacterized protein n=1 Tax=Pyrus ussuriensis x Pyrus communis TaxID=2448454 RepID=A0A5N5FAX8_9ROSA|nr:hypothetical protein D8674_009372 [Pyrus ussuriensis x Pyrus communis]